VSNGSKGYSLGIRGAKLGENTPKTRLNEVHRNRIGVLLVILGIKQVVSPKTESLCVVLQEFSVSMERPSLRNPFEG
jgi:hypothetical protein